MNAAVFLAASVVLLGLAAGRAEETHTFKKIPLTGKFWSEGAFVLLHQTHSNRPAK